VSAGLDRKSNRDSVEQSPQQSTSAVSSGASVPDISAVSSGASVPDISAAISAFTLETTASLPAPPALPKEDISKDQVDGADAIIDPPVSIPTLTTLQERKASGSSCEDVVPDSNSDPDSDSDSDSELDGDSESSSYSDSDLDTNVDRARRKRRRRSSSLGRAELILIVSVISLAIMIHNHFAPRVPSPKITMSSLPAQGEAEAKHSTTVLPVIKLGTAYLERVVQKRIGWQCSLVPELRDMPSAADMYLEWLTVLLQQSDNVRAEIRKLHRRHQQMELPTPLPVRVSFSEHHAVFYADAQSGIELRVTLSSAHTDPDNTAIDTAKRATIQSMLPMINLEYWALRLRQLLSCRSVRIVLPPQPDKEDYKIADRMLREWVSHLQHSESKIHSELHSMDMSALNFHLVPDHTYADKIKVSSTEANTLMVSRTVTLYEVVAKLRELGEL
jgi:hypothetical protein